MVKGASRSPAEVIIFSIITCGIYYLYWLYKFASELNGYLGDQRSSPGVDLLLCIFCFPYQIYWFYKYGKAISEAQIRAGLPAEDNAILYVILSIFGLGIVNAAIMQSAMNKVWAQSYPEF